MTTTARHPTGARAGAQPPRRFIDRVIVPLDGSALAADALTPAVALARRIGASIELLTTRWDGRVDSALEYLGLRAARLGVEAVATVVDRERNAPDAILHAAERPGSLVCMATHGRTGPLTADVGGVTNEVLHRTVQPVLLVGPHLERRSSAFTAPNVVVAVDGSRLSETILPVGLAWAELLGARPWLAQVVDPGPKLPFGTTDVVEGGYLETLARRPGNAPFAWDVLHGDDPADALVDYARRLPASVLVVATHARSGFARALGSVALRVAGRSACPVVVAHPRALHHAEDDPSALT